MLNVENRFVQDLKAGNKKDICRAPAKGYGGTGSTGTKNTVRVGDTGKYGDAFVDPMESFRKLGYTDSQIDMNTGSSLIRR